MNNPVPAIPSPAGAIMPDSTVNDVLLRHPATVAVFNAFGVDACCGGAASLADAARDAGISLDALLDALRHSAGADGGRTT